MLEGQQPATDNLQHTLNTAHVRWLASEGWSAPSCSSAPPTCSNIYICQACAWAQELAINTHICRCVRAINMRLDLTWPRRRVSMALKTITRMVMMKMEMGMGLGKVTCGPSPSRGNGNSPWLRLMACISIGGVSRVPGRVHANWKAQPPLWAPRRRGKNCT